MFNLASTGIPAKEAPKGIINQQGERKMRTIVKIVIIVLLCLLLKSSSMM